MAEPLLRFLELGFEVVKTLAAEVLRFYVPGVTLDARVGFGRLDPIRSENPTDLRHVVLDVTFLLDNLSQGLAPKSEVLRAFLRKRWELLGALLLGKFGGWPGRREV